MKRSRCSCEAEEEEDKTVKRPRCSMHSVMCFTAPGIEIDEEWFEGMPKESYPIVPDVGCDSVQALFRVWFALESAKDWIFKCPRDIAIKSLLATANSPPIIAKAEVATLMSPQFPPLPTSPLFKALSSFKPWSPCSIMDSNELRYYVSSDAPGAFFIIIPD